jgi:hypothetical protein
MTRNAVRGISAPPEVVYNTVIDPTRRAAWLPRGIDTTCTAGDVFEVRLSCDGAGPAGVLYVRPGDAGGSSVELSITRGPSPEEILWDLEREVAENLNAG